MEQMWLSTWYVIQLFFDLFKVGIMNEVLPRWTFDAIHHQAAAHVAQCVSKTPHARLVHISAIGADLNSPISYPRSKAQGEQAICDAMSNTSASAVILRPGYI